jgi:hypothetical protein
MFKDFYLPAAIFFQCDCYKTEIVFARVVSVDMRSVTVTSAAVLLAANILLCHYPGSSHSAKLRKCINTQICSCKASSVHSCTAKHSKLTINFAYPAKLK